MDRQLLEIFKECGIYLHDDERDSQLELDSIQYISILVMIEEELDVVIPEEYLTEIELSTFNEFISMINGLKDKK